METTVFIKIPVGFEQDETGVVLFNTEETDKLIGKIGIVVQENTWEEAQKSFLGVLASHIDWLERRSNELDRWKPFQHGNWKHTGGSWFTVFGLHFYFRYGKNMKHGWYIPFTKLNILFSNYWRKSSTKSK